MKENPLNLEKQLANMVKAIALIENGGANSQNHPLMQNLEVRKIVEGFKSSHNSQK